MINVEVSEAQLSSFLEKNNQRRHRQPRAN